MDFPTALKILRCAPDETLNAHAIETISTLRDIEKRLHCNLAPSLRRGNDALHSGSPSRLPLESFALNHPTEFSTHSPGSESCATNLVRPGVCQFFESQEALGNQPFSLDRIGYPAHVFDEILGRPPSGFTSPQPENGFGTSPIYSNGMGIQANFFDDVISQQVRMMSNFIDSSDRLPHSSLSSTPLHPPTSPSTPTSQSSSVSLSPLFLPNDLPYMNSATPIDAKAGMRINKIIKGVKKAVIKLDEARKISAPEIITRKRKLEDPRLDDIRLVDGDIKIDDASKLRRILALRSFAFHFDENQIKEHIKPSRLTELYDLAYYRSQKPAGKKAAKVLDTKVLNTGLKHIVFELIWQNSLHQRGIKGNHDSISFLMGLNIGNFHDLGYSDMMAAVNLMWNLNISNNTEKTLPLYLYLQDSAGWFHSLQCLYNMKIPGQSESYTERIAASLSTCTQEVVRTLVSQFDHDEAQAITSNPMSISKTIQPSY